MVDVAIVVGWLYILSRHGKTTRWGVGDTNKYLQLLIVTIVKGKVLNGMCVGGGGGDMKGSVGMCVAVL